MARIRSIKPEFWTDEKIVELSAFARLLFIGLWNFADDEGRMIYSPKRIKMQIFPADSIDISELFGEIRREKLVTVYVIEGVEYLQISNFTEHQKIDKRSASKLPSPESSPESPRIPTTDQGRDQGRDIYTPPVGGGYASAKTEKPDGFNPADFLKTKGVPDQIAKDWLKVRKTKKLVPTLTALEDIEHEAGKAGITFAEAITRSCRNGWAGFKASWTDGMKQDEPAAIFAGAK